MKKWELKAKAEVVPGFEAEALAWRKASWQLGTHLTTRWFGVPIVQTPEDIVLLCEVVYKVMPNMIIETGTFYGGSAVFYVSLLALFPSLHARIITVDIDHTTQVLERLKSYPQISAVTGDSVNQGTFDAVKKIVASDRHDFKLLVVLDSDHSKSHVAEELRLYSELVTPGSYLVVLDTGFEDLHDAPGGKEEWRDDNPAAAVREFLLEHKEFEADVHFDRFKVGFANGGFLRRVGKKNEYAIPG